MDAVADDDVGFLVDFRINDDVGDVVDDKSVGVVVRSLFCIDTLLLFFGDDVIPSPVVAVADGDANILLFNKGHP